MLSNLISDVFNQVISFAVDPLKKKDPVTLVTGSWVRVFDLFISNLQKPMPQPPPDCPQKNNRQQADETSPPGHNKPLYPKRGIYLTDQYWPFRRVGVVVDGYRTNPAMGIKPVQVPIILV